MPDRNIERLLRNKIILVLSEDNRRLDLIVTGLNVHRGLPLFCDVTIVSPISGNGEPRGGTSNRNGGLLQQAQQENDDTYHAVVVSGLGSLLCLGSEVFGRWSLQFVDMVPALARERSRGQHPCVGGGVALSLQQRWWAVLGLAVQRAVAHTVLSTAAGVDLMAIILEPAAALADLSSI